MEKFFIIQLQDKNLYSGGIHFYAPNFEEVDGAY